MSLAENILVAIVALEMFFWTQPFGMRIFGLTPEFAEASSALAANQGLYNGLLAAGLIWGLVGRQGAFPIKAFFLVCVSVAGVFGAFTAKTSILFVQAATSLLPLALVIGSRREDDRSEP